MHAIAIMDKVKPAYFSINRIWRRSLKLAELSRSIAQRETGDPKIAEDAYTAGLLHDLGTAVLACNLHEQYQRATRMSSEQQIRISAAEIEVFGAAHAQVGAYLLALWGLPATVVEAVGCHQVPSRSDETS